MNAGYAISDLVLALACGFVGWRLAGRLPGVAVACGAIGVAAIAGVVRFSGLEGFSGAHRFLSLVAGTAGLPLLAASLHWPDSKVAGQVREAVIALLVLSALGIAIVVGAGFSKWGQWVPAASAVGLLASAIIRRAEHRGAGAIVLLTTFGLVSANRTVIAGLAPIEFLHYGMALALLLLGL